LATSSRQKGLYGAILADFGSSFLVMDEESFMGQFDKARFGVDPNGPLILDSFHTCTLAVL
jgi:hypothetical protein